MKILLLRNAGKIGAVRQKLLAKAGYASFDKSDAFLMVVKSQWDY